MSENNAIGVDLPDKEELVKKIEPLSFGNYLVSSYLTSTNKQPTSLLCKLSRRILRAKGGNIFI